MALTDTTCKNAKPKEKLCKLSDGKGLNLYIMPHGAKLWRYRYRFNGKENTLSLGSYPETSLAEAREACITARKTLKSGTDPAQAKKEDKRQKILNAENTFEAIAREWHDTQKGRWSEGYAGKVIRCLTMNIFPYIGNRPIAQITPPELLDVLRKIEKRDALDILGRTKQICGQVFRYGIQTGRCERDAAADLNGALKTRKTEHYRTIEIKDIPAFLVALERNDARLFARTQRALRLSVLTFLRPQEIRMAQWSEIDFDKATWSIPAERMKMRKPHIVPLSRQATAIFMAQREETGMLKTDFVFPAQTKLSNCMSDGTVNKAIKRLGFGDVMVAHGLRALARTTIREELGYDSEVIEKQLAHKTSNPLGEAYDRTQFLDKRRMMMQHWADYLDAQAAIGTGKVVEGRFKQSA